MTVLDAKTRFGPVCHCGKVGTAVVFPHVDHRRKKPWPQPYWLCDEHA